MPIKEYICSKLSIRIEDHNHPLYDEFHQPQEQRAEGEDATLVGDRMFGFVQDAPATLAERFPRLIVGAVAVAVLLGALTAEIDYLRGSGYYWW